MKKVRYSILTLFFLAVFVNGCGAGPEHLNFGVDLSSVRSALTGKAYIKINIYTSQKNLLKGKAYHTFPCQEVHVTNTNPYAEFQVSSIPVGNDNAVVFQIFADSKCKDLVGVGVRGNIGVYENPEKPPVYYVQIIAKGRGTRFPEPKDVIDSDKNSNIDTSSCKTDKDCADISPAAWCYQGSCHLESLFPLNNRVLGAFGTAISVDNGQIIGLPAIEGNYLTMNMVDTDSGMISHYFDDSRMIIFNGLTGLFSEEAMVPPSLGGHAFSGKITLPNGYTIIIGGLNKVPLVSIDNVNIPFISNDFSAIDKKTDLEGNAGVIAITPQGEVITKGAMPGKTSAIVAPAVFAIGINKFIIAGGLVKDAQGWHPSSITWTGTVDDNGTITIKKNNKLLLSVPRIWPSVSCLEKAKEGYCKTAIIFGGVASTDKFADYYDGSKFIALKGKLKSGIEAKKMYFIGGHAIPINKTTVMTVGGYFASNFTGKVNIANFPATLQWTVELDKKTTTMSLCGDYSQDTTIRDELKGLYSVMTKVSSNKYLITGGIKLLDNKKLGVGKTAILIDLSKIDKDINDMTFTRYKLNIPRFGHMVGQIQTGPLKGTLLLLGGFDLDKSGNLMYVRHAEALLP